MFSVGIVLGPILHLWYVYLDKFLPERTRKVVAKKILADQLIASPPLAALFFFDGLDHLARGPSGQLLLRPVVLSGHLRERDHPGMGHIPFLPQAPGRQDGRGRSNGRARRRRAEGGRLCRVRGDRAVRGEAAPCRGGRAELEAGGLVVAGWAAGVQNRPSARIWKGSGRAVARRGVSLPVSWPCGS
ncbi:uncharacterized protein LOC144734524 isoform X3 [Lampetra planeri]